MFSQNAPLEECNALHAPKIYTTAQGFYPDAELIRCII